jgi:hypothetical protein
MNVMYVMAVMRIRIVLAYVMVMLLSMNVEYVMAVD